MRHRGSSHSRLLLLTERMWFLVPPDPVDPTCTAANRYSRKAAAVGRPATHAATDRTRRCSTQSPTAARRYRRDFPDRVEFRGGPRRGRMSLGDQQCDGVGELEFAARARSIRRKASKIARSAGTGRPREGGRSVLHRRFSTIPTTLRTSGWSRPDCLDVEHAVRADLLLGHVDGAQHAAAALGAHPRHGLEHAARHHQIVRRSNPMASSSSSSTLRRTLPRDRGPAARPDDGVDLQQSRILPDLLEQVVLAAGFELASRGRGPLDEVSDDTVLTGEVTMTRRFAPESAPTRHQLDARACRPPGVTPSERSSSQ